MVLESLRMYFKRNKGRQGHNPGKGGRGVELLQQVRHKCLRGFIQLEDKGVPFPTTGSGGHAVLHVPSIPHFRLNLKNSSTEVWRCPFFWRPFKRSRRENVCEEYATIVWFIRNISFVLLLCPVVKFATLLIKLF